MSAKRIGVDPEDQWLEEVLSCGQDGECGLGVREQLEEELPLREQNLPAFSFSNWSQNGSLTVRHIWRQDLEATCAVGVGYR
jgi:hypothetical protein